MATCLLVIFDLTPAYSQDESNFEFFPWESCLLLSIEKTERSGNDLICHAIIDDVLRGNYSKRNPISVCVSQGDSAGDSPIQSRFTEGKKVLVAFNSLPLNRFRKQLKIYNEYFPFADSIPNAADIDKLKKRLDNSSFPFRACVNATITKNKFVKKGCEACHPGRTDIEAIINEVYLPDSLSKVETTDASKEKTVPKTFHANLKKGEKLSAFFYEDSARPLKKGKCYIWKFNPVYHDEKNPKRIFLGLNGGTFSAESELSTSEMEALKKFPERFENYLADVRNHMQQDIEKSWTKEQISIYTSKPELRYIPRTPGVVVSEGNLLSGQIQKNNEAELGKVIWFSGMQDGKPCGEYQLQVHKGGADFWVLDSGYFSKINKMSQSEFYKKYFKDLLTKCGITYTRINNLKENKELMPGRAPISLQLDEHQNITGIACPLQNDKTLKAKVDADMNLSQFEIDENKSSLWQNAYDNRILNMDKVWQETLKYEKW
ncbi:MAG: hypothetical protein SFY67_05575 [Candidatus Melainabacteria bacterium]|nr:hypothetical protein [Candidatus Melainabacteria bacterium]